MRVGLARVPPPEAGRRWEGLATGAWPGEAPPGAWRDAREVHARPADPEAAFARAREALSLYRVYRPGRLRARVLTPDGRMAPGALVVQRVRLGPLVVEAGVRVVDLVDAEDGAGRTYGYAYATLPGHPERGVARFRLRLDRRAGEVSFGISSWSMPGHWLTRVGRPYARRLQLRETAAALARMEGVLRG